MRQKNKKLKEDNMNETDIVMEEKKKKTKEENIEEIDTV